MFIYTYISSYIRLRYTSVPLPLHNLERSPYCIRVVWCISQERKTDEQNYNGGVRGRVATEFVLVTEAFMAPRGGARALEGVSCANVLLMHSRCDNYVDPAGSVAFYERAQCAGSKALLLFGGDADASELRTAGPSTAHAELEALKDVDMCHLLTQEPGAERLAAAAAKWLCECNARVR